MKNIAVVCGGYSKEEVISLKSAGQIVQSIDAAKFKTFTVLINKKEWVVKASDADIPIDKNDFSFTHQGQKVKFDAVFMAIHGTPGEDGKLQAYFEMMNIPVTTCNSFVSALTFNKYACKSFLGDYGVLTANAVLLRKNNHYAEDEIIDSLGLPVFVKPNNGGSSFGVTKVKAVDQLHDAIHKAFEEDTEIILEEFIEGREFTCGVFINDESDYVLPLTEIVSKNEFFDYQAKYEGFCDEITPARLGADETAECQEIAYDIYKLLNCNGLVRIDFLYKNEKFYFMEVNTVPGVSKESIIPQQIRAYGLTETEFYTNLIEDAINRAG